MPEMAQFMISIPQDVRDRLDALHIVMGTSRAEVGREILSRYVHLLERSHQERIKRLNDTAKKRGYPNWTGLVRDVIEHSARQNSTNRGQRLPSLEELEDPDMPRFHRERGTTSGVIPAQFSEASGS